MLFHYLRLTTGDYTTEHTRFLQIRNDDAITNVKLLGLMTGIIVYDPAVGEDAINITKDGFDGRCFPDQVFRILRFQIQILYE